jgi:hypothetical protein
MSIHGWSFVFGAFAKICATLATYPMQVVQSVLRTQGSKSKSETKKEKEKEQILIQKHKKTDGDDASDTIQKTQKPKKSKSSQSKTKTEKEKAKEQIFYAGTLDCLVRIFAKDGLGGLYRGLTVKLWQTVLTSALMFMLYEHIVLASSALFLQQ